MIKLLIKRPKDEVVCVLIQFKESKKWSFVNLTKEHICPCQFDNIDDAFKDLDTYVKDGRVISYEVLETIIQIKKETGYPVSFFICIIVIL